MQNIECQSEIQCVQTTPTNEAYQQQFLEKGKTQEIFIEQNNPPSIIQNSQPLFVSPQTYQCGPQPPQNVKVIQQVNFMEQQIKLNHSRKSIMFYCPYCRAYGETQITYSMGIKSFQLVLFLCILTLVCFWIPCFNKNCQNVNHFCPNCGQKVGEVKYGDREIPQSFQVEKKEEVPLAFKLGVLALSFLIRK